MISDRLGEQNTGERERVRHELGHGVVRTSVEYSGNMRQVRWEEAIIYICYDRS